MMAKINFNSQENSPLAGAILGPWGFLMCMICTVVGIKLWWFKHRLSFEQSTEENKSSNKEASPSAVVARREKKPRFSRDKRLSQQVYHNVQVYGSFRQTKEDDILIEGSSQLPPVRIRQAESAPSLLMPPPRNKRRPLYVQSTAFEELSESYTNALPSDNSPGAFQKNSSNFVAPVPSNVVPKQQELITETTSLNFKEVEKVSVAPVLRSERDIVMEEVPVVPKRVSRSSSTSAKQQQNDVEKSHRLLKSSQSISIPEHRKVVERRSTGFYKPTEDLTKIDDLEEPRFEKFGDRRPTGYIRYDDVDFEEDLRDYRQEEVRKFYDYQDYELLETLRNQEIIYQNPTSPDICEINEAIETFEKSSLQKNAKHMGVEEEAYKHFVDGSSRKKEANGNLYEESFKWREQQRFYEKETFFETQKPYLNRENHSYGNHKSEQSLNKEPDIEKIADFKEENLSNSKGKPTPHARKVIAIGNKSEKSSAVDGPNVTPVASDRLEEIFSFNEQKVVIDMENEFTPQTLAFVDDSDQISGVEDSPSYKQNQHFKAHQQTHEVRFDKSFPTEEEADEKFTLNQRRPTAYVVSSLRDEEEEEEPQEHQVRFGDSFGKEDQKEDKFTLNQRRPTAYIIRSAENYEDEDEHEPVVKFAHEVEEKFTLNQRRPTAYVVGSLEDNEEEDDDEEVRDHKVRFQDSLEEKFTLNQRRPTAYVIGSLEDKEEEEDEEVTEHKVRFDGDSEEKFTLNQRRPTAYVIGSLEDKKEVNEDIPDHKVRFEESLEQKFTLNQRRPTAYVIGFSDDNQAEDEEKPHQNHFVRFEDNFAYENAKEKFTLNQRRPTAYVLKSSMENLEDEEDDEDSTKQKVRFQDDSSRPFQEPEEKFTLNQRRPTAYVISGTQEDEEEDDEDDDSSSLAKNKVKFEDDFVDVQLEEKFTLNQRRPTAFVASEKEDAEEKKSKVKFEQQLNHQEKFTLNQRRPTAYAPRSYQAEDFEDMEANVKNLSYAEEVYEDNVEMTTAKASAEKSQLIWQDLEKDLELNFAQNIEEEFSRIRQSFEMNEADFLELKEDLQLASPTNSTPSSPTKTLGSIHSSFGNVSPNGFGKTIDDDWENFEKLQPNTQKKQEDISLTYNMMSNARGMTTVSILKESKMGTEPEEPTTLKPARKSKVTFDSKTEEHLIPARKSPSDEEEEEDDYDSPHTKPPIPMQRLSNLNYSRDENPYQPVVVSPNKISLFGSLQKQDEDYEDSWSAIRKHRHMTSQFQKLTVGGDRVDSEPPSYPPPPLPISDEDDDDDDEQPVPSPKAAYRNPMAQLAIQRAKEVRNDMGGFKGRSLKDVRKKASLQSEEVLNLKDNFDATEA
ncbi:probable serine/threonine-protein kinase kinX [Stomoxys calcitrans]|uniref:probable serine/threonine-protein kinase kinX n=1 Tax=Stomoxys calcitrans TaxID=35570 RepID=UPI0027E231F7|nr:probable serine/threonine-protein kinase kinX [Stomoxys calcitrans]